jgi:hypothetical protein
MLAFYLINEAEIKESINRKGRDKDILFSYYTNSRLNQLEVLYKQKSKNTGGRMQAVGSVSGQGMLREVRHTIYNNIYTDVDVVNCHPVLLRFVCLNIGLKEEHYSYLDKYINNREEVFEELSKANDDILSKEYIKMCFLSILNGGEKDYKELKVKTDFIVGFKNEVNKLAKLLSNIFTELYIEVRNKKRNEGKDFNLLGSFLSHLMLFLENKALEFNVNLNIVKEHYTSKTCGVCGNTKDIGSDSEYECKNCKCHLDRDLNGARNILIKHFGLTSVV